MRIQKNFNLFFIALVIFYSGVLSAQSNLPTTQIKSLDGKNVTLKDYIKDGKITVISFWATWCAPCKKRTGRN